MRIKDLIIIIVSLFYSGSLSITYLSPPLLQFSKFIENKLLYFDHATPYRP